jgi:hypothetical protein
VIDIEPDGRAEILYGGTTVSKSLQKVAVFLDDKLTNVSLGGEEWEIVEGWSAVAATRYVYGCGNVDDSPQRELLSVEIKWRDDGSATWTRIAYHVEGAQAVVVLENHGTLSRVDQEAALPSDIVGDDCAVP